jgi:tetratricopeptide (TPR) repeat protein
LIIFVYKVSINFERKEPARNASSIADAGGDEGEKHFPLVSFIVMIVALLFFISGQFIGGIIPGRLQISNSEINPSFSATMSITKGGLVKHPLLGVGPNRFGEAWSMYKPMAINNTQFWDVSFSSGSGLLPTLFATTGALGLLAWLVFFVLFLVIGARSVFSSIKKGVNWEMMAFFILSLYLFISSFFYFTGTAIFLLSLAFTGIFIGLAASGSDKEIAISFLNDHRKSFFSILALILVVILSLTFSFKYVERFASVSYFSKALSATTEPAAENSIGKALSLYQNDLYLRTYSQIYLVKLNSIVSKGSNLSDADKADLQASFDQAVNGAQMAVAYDPSNYLNFQLLGSVYQAAGTLGVKDAYSKAESAYQSASLLNPLNPGLKLALAGAYFADGKVEDAKDSANQALTLKPDYIDALITLSQIAKSEGDNAKALSYAQAALSITPTDNNLIQYVNSLNGSAPSATPAPASTSVKSKK